MAKSLLSVKGKKKTVRKTKSENYLVNWKYLGDEPKNVTFDTVELLKAFNWYNVMAEKEDTRQYLKDYFKSDKDKIKLIDRIPDNRLPSTSAWLCRIAVNNGIVLDNTKLSRITNDIKDAAAHTLQEEVKEKPTTPKPSIQDRVKERVSDIIGDIEELIDSGVPFSLYDWLKKNEIPAMYANKIGDYYGPIWGELTLAQTDPVIGEGYKNYTAKQLRERVAFYNQLVADAERYGDNTKKARAPRKKKAPTAEKLLKHFQYQKESNEYKLQSCDPATIIGAQELWVFNTKYKTLGVYRARGPAGLSIKRTSINGYDNDASLIKRVGRKPEEYVKKVLSGGKIILRKLMEDIKSDPITFTDRINNNIVLIKVVR